MWTCRAMLGLALVTVVTAARAATQEEGARRALLTAADGVQAAQRALGADARLAALATSLRADTRAASDVETGAQFRAAHPELANRVVEAWQLLGRDAAAVQGARGPALQHALQDLTGAHRHLADLLPQTH